MSERVLRFELDFISPYAYITWHAVKPIAAKHGVRIEAVPILFAALLDAHGHLGPAEIPPKRAYVFKDSWRRAHALGLPLVPPPGHPFNPLLALRVASLDLPHDLRDACVTALFHAAWGTGEGVTDPAVVERITTGLGIADAVERAADPAVKARVRDATTRAIERGTFGVPSLWVDGELFWGSDSLPYVDAWLAGEDPVPDDLLARWADLPPESRRPASTRR
ncbi:MAG: 2-hydroxychromene-2-carboxylate isomerase [Myxococcota bacterium]